MRKIILIYILLCGYISCIHQNFNIKKKIYFSEEVFKN